MTLNEQTKKKKGGVHVGVGTVLFGILITLKGVSKNQNQMLNVRRQSKSSNNFHLCF